MVINTYSKHGLQEENTNIMLDKINDLNQEADRVSEESKNRKSKTCKRMSSIYELIKKEILEEDKEVGQLQPDLSR